MDGDYLLRLILDWVPFIAFVGIMVFFMRKGVGGRQVHYMEAVRQYHVEHLEETRKIRAALDRIAATLEQKP